MKKRLNIKKWPPDGKNVNPRNRTILKILLIFIVAGVILFLLAVVFNQQVQLLGNTLYKRTGHVSMQGLSGLVLAGFVGVIQTWIFRGNIKEKHLLSFFLSSVIGGFLGGALVGGLLNLEVIENGSLIEGGLIGAFAGGLSGLGQSFLMGNFRIGYKWLLFNLFSWAFIWALGWYVSLNVLDTTIFGAAAAAAIIVILSGIMLSIFLYLYPQIEF